MIRLFAAVLVVVLLGWPAAAHGRDDVSDPVGVWPLRPAPRVVARFDPPDSAYGAGHRGVDLAAHPGQVVHSALAGRVTFTGKIAGRGVVVVSHGETRTTYEPVHASVAVGDRISAGSAIGTLDTFGSHCFPRVCLHWGWLRGETYLDPLRLVGSTPVRLLPLWRAQPAPVALRWLPLSALLGEFELRPVDGLARRRDAVGRS
ncbi:MAG: M23 family metallopeptidase [Nocardioidaceae bacterium]|nr:M23 family metallopeptidase [Nocardioidaceae bacterium]